MVEIDWGFLIVILLVIFSVIIIVRSSGFMEYRSATFGDLRERSLRSFYTLLRLDTALPSQVQQCRSFELAVAIRQPDSPTLQEEDLDKTKSGGLNVTWPRFRNRIALRVHICAPECQIQGKDSWSFRLKKEQDSPVHYFQLTPQQAGRIGIVVTVYQKQEWLGGARLHTVAHEQVTGKVAVQVYSRRIDNLHEAQVKITESIYLHFNPLELRQLCFVLNVAYDDLPGEAHSEKARELVTYMVRHGRFPDLIAQCQQERPQIDWYALAEMQPMTNK